MTRRRLPIGIQTFRTLRERDCYYVDKTAHARALLNEGTHYFLSRPRRFGKSLFLDTLKDLFEGNESLFAGLDIHDQWDWSVRHPVVRLSFGSGNFKEPGHVEARLTEQLAAVERRAGLVPESTTVPGRFGDVLEALHRKTGQSVAVLVDEYDQADPRRAGRARRGAGQPRFPARRLRGHQGPRRARPVRVSHRGEQEPSAGGARGGNPRTKQPRRVSLFSGPQQPEGHHARPALLDHLRLHRRGP